MTCKSVSITFVDKIIIARLYDSPCSLSLRQAMLITLRLSTYRRVKGVDLYILSFFQDVIPFQNNSLTFF